MLSAWKRFREDIDHDSTAPKRSELTARLVPVDRNPGWRSAPRTGNAKPTLGTPLASVAAKNVLFALKLMARASRVTGSAPISLPPESIETNVPVAPSEKVQDRL